LDAARATVSSRHRLAAWFAAALGSLALLHARALDAQPDDDGGWNFDDEDEVAPTLAQLAQAQALEIGLFAAFATLAMVSFFLKSKPLKYVTLVVSVLYLGFYKSLLLTIVNVFGVLSLNLPTFANN